MLEIRPFEPEDLQQLIPREPDMSIANSVGDYIEVARMYAKHGPAFTGIWNGTVLVCAGVIILLPGCGEGWAYTSTLVPAAAIPFHRAIKRKLDEIMREKQLRRLQVAIPDFHTVSRNWIQRLGFIEESAMPKFGASGETYFRYVRFACPR